MENSGELSQDWHHIALKATGLSAVRTRFGPVVGHKCPSLYNCATNLPVWAGWDVITQSLLVAERNTITRSDEIRLSEALEEVKEIKTVAVSFMTYNLVSKSPDSVELSPAPPSGLSYDNKQK